MVTIISLGGSIVAPDQVDTAFLKLFITTIRSLLSRQPGMKIVFIVGGGGPARAWQSAFRECSPEASHESQDWIGIMATRMNAELVKQLFAPECLNPVVTDPYADISFSGRILVAAGWKPGFSTDFDAVCLGERFGARTIINLSNIAKVYTDDPRKNPAAKPLDKISWQEFRLMVGDSWEPGKNVPFDPVASKKAEALGMQVIAAAGKNLPNLINILEEQPFIGTTIG